MTSRVRFHPTRGYCLQCEGGWLCRDCIADNQEREKRRSAALAETVLSARTHDVAKLCSKHELESDEFMTRERRAMAIMGRGKA
jgi:hypothetical protein